jgi:hypothetical protein
MAGGMCMLFAGELAVRKVSEMESTVSLHVSRFNFRVAARIQVGWTACPFLLACLRSRPISAATYRAQYTGHRSFCTEPPSQERPPARKSSSRVDYLPCVRLRFRRKPLQCNLISFQYSPRYSRSS